MKEFRELVRKNRGLISVVFLLLLLISVPLYKQGIACNDELISRLWGMQGLFTFYKHFFGVYLEVGRALAAPVASLTMYLGFIGDGAGGFRLLQILTIWLDAGLFAILLYKLFHSKGFSVICGLSVVAFLPVVFEHTAPNAFNALLNLPFALLLWSLILFVDYLDYGRKGTLIGSLLLLFINLTCYESFLMYVPLYWCLVVGKERVREWKRMIRKCLYPAVTAFVFLVLYVVFRVLVPTEYEGIQISGFSLKSAVEVVWQLVRVCFPGYYLFIPEYRHQAQEYNQLQIENYIRILLVCVLFGMILFHFLKKEERNRMGTGAFWGCLGAGVLCIVLPAFPLAAAKMYQESVGSWWRALPTTYFCYFGATFVCWFCIWRLINRYNIRMLAAFSAVGAAVYLFPVQSMNDIFAQQQNKVFQRLLGLEALFSTELAESFAGKDFFSTDMFRSINIFSVHASYWDDFADMKGLNVKITNGQGTQEDRRIYYDDSQYAVWAGDALCILTPDPKSGYGVCQYSADEFKLVRYQEPLEDNGLYEYYYMLSDGELQPIDRGVFLTELSQKTVGTTLEGCRKLRGYHGDGWLERESQFLIMTGDKGKIEMEIYGPPGDFIGGTMSIYVDNVLYEEVRVQEGSQVISIEAEPDKLIRLSLESDFVQQNTERDERELTVVLASLQGS